MDARINCGLPAHPKTKKLIRRIGEAGAWHLVCLFLWVAQTRPSGSLEGMTGEDVELAADWSGDEGAFVRALVEVGFLDGEEESYSIHDWHEHNPWAAGQDARSEKARWLSLCKHHGRDGARDLMPEYAARILANAESRATASPKQADSTPTSTTSKGNPASSMQEAENSSAPSPSPSPLPYPYPKELTNPDGLVVASTADDEQTEPGLKKSTTPNCPQQALLDLYAECLPELPQPRAWEGQAADNLRSRWRWVLTATKRGSCERYATTADEGMEWFRRFFGYVAGSDFLMGRKADWQADLRWLVKAANFDKVLSGAYENGRAAA